MLSILKSDGRRNVHGYQFILISFSPTEEALEHKMKERSVPLIVPSRDSDKYRRINARME